MGDGAGDKVKYDNGVWTIGYSNFTKGGDPEDRFYLAGEDEPWDPYRDGGATHGGYAALEVQADYCGCGEPMTFMEAS